MSRMITIGFVIITREEFFETAIYFHYFLIISPWKGRSHLFDQNYPHQLKLYCAILLLTSGSVDGYEYVISSTRTTTTTDKDDEQRTISDQESSLEPSAQMN